MPCFVTRPNPPSKEEFAIWQTEFGYTGTFDDYIKDKEEFLERNKNLNIFVCGSMEGFEYCSVSDCLGFDEYLCDYPVGDGRTCDFKLCGTHAHQIGSDLHYCEAHFQLWLKEKPLSPIIQEMPIGVLVGSEYFPIEKLWIAKNISTIKSLPLVKVYSEKIE